MLTDVAVVVAEPVPGFELGVAGELFGLPRADPSLPRYRFAVCAEQAGPLRSSTGFAVTPTHDLTRLDTADLILVTGAAPPIPPVTPALTAALRRAEARGATVAAVCTGAFVLAAAGLLAGRTATTHWAYAGLLADRHPDVTVDPDRIYVVDGPIATSAGASAAIDLCLHLMRREQGAEITNRVAREMVVPPHRTGGQSQFSRLPVPGPERAGADGMAGLLDWAVAHLHEDLPVEALALRAAMSTRTFIRRFTDATGTTPAAWIRAQRVLKAEILLERESLPIAAVARRCGFGSPDTLRRHFRRSRGVSPETYRAAFRAIN